jgi:hypothetical protein
MVSDKMRVKDTSMTHFYVAPETVNIRLNEN